MHGFINYIALAFGISMNSIFVYFLCINMFSLTYSWFETSMCYNYCSHSVTVEPRPRFLSNFFRVEPSWSMDRVSWATASYWWSLVGRFLWSSDIAVESDRCPGVGQTAKQACRQACIACRQPASKADRQAASQADRQACKQTCSQTIDFSRYLLQRKPTRAHVPTALNSYNYEECNSKTRPAGEWALHVRCHDNQFSSHRAWLA